MFEWFAKARWRLSFSHCFEGLIIQAPCFLLFGAWPSVAAVAVWYWSRKKLEVEMDHGHDADPVSTWAVGWLPWTWDKWRQLDVYLPTLSASLLALFFG